MGNHRGQRRAAPTRRSAPLDAAARRDKREKYVGRRVAGRTDDAAATPHPAPVVSVAPELSPEIPTDVVEPQLAARITESAQVEPTVATRPLFATPTPTVELPSLAELADLTGEHSFDGLSDSSTGLSAAAPGKRRAVRHAGPRGPLFKGLPTLPVAVGVATLAVAVGGAVTSAQPTLVSDSDRVVATNALTGSFGTGTYDALRTSGVSRDSDRTTLEGATDAELVDQAEKASAQRDAALVELQKGAEKEAAEIALNRWVLPMDSYRITATYGQYGLWSSYHTGLDFAAPSGTPIRAVTNGVISSTGYDGAYGNKTVLTLEDGTEIWFCHQTSYEVSAGDVVQAGEVIGYVGSTGNVTGPHLHLEVRPGGGDPVDPDAALRQHGVTP